LEEKHFLYVLYWIADGNAKKRISTIHDVHMQVFSVSIEQRYFAFRWWDEGSLNFASPGMGTDITQKETPALCCPSIKKAGHGCPAS
jgi:hypothetical protein